MGQFALGDPREKTIALDPLDLLPASAADRVRAASAHPTGCARPRAERPRVARVAALPPPPPVSLAACQHVVQGGEPVFVMQPSWPLRVRKGLRDAHDDASLLARALYGAARRTLPTSEDWRGVALRALPLRMRLRIALGRARTIAGAGLVEIQKVSAEQRRTAAGAFVAGALFASLLAWVI